LLDDIMRIVYEYTIGCAKNWILFLL
jgi:hypothetical protein